MKRSSESLAYLRVKIAADKLTDEWNYNPTGDDVKFAFVGSEGLTDAATWYNGSWETRGNPQRPKYFAMCLIGPGGTVALPIGSYNIWVKITDSPEIPVEYAGLLEVE